MHDRIWITQDLRAIPVSKMETRHIVNCIRMIERRRAWRREFLDRLILELEIRNLLERS